jgi:hypothetical protein
MSKFMLRLTAAALSATLLISCTSAATLPNVGNQVKSSTVTTVSADQIKSLYSKINDDDTFSDSLDKDAKAALKAQGIALADSEQVKVLKLQNKIFMVLDDRNLKTFHSDLLTQTEADKSDLQKQLDAVRAKANSDPGFKAKLLSDTSGTLKAEGVSDLVTDMIQVVDSQPNTSLLLVAGPGVEINRGVAADVIKTLIRSFFQTGANILSDVLDRAFNKIEEGALKLNDLQIKALATVVHAAAIVLRPGLTAAGVPEKFFTRSFYETSFKNIQQLFVDGVVKLITEIESEITTLNQTLQRLLNDIKNLNEQIKTAVGPEKEVLQKKLKDTEFEISNIRQKIKELENKIVNLIKKYTVL